jgi:hypothetical protein
VSRPTCLPFRQVSCFQHGPAAGGPGTSSVPDPTGHRLQQTLRHTGQQADQVPGSVRSARIGRRDICGTISGCGGGGAPRHEAHIASIRPASRRTPHPAARTCSTEPKYDTAHTASLRTGWPVRPTWTPPHRHRRDGIAPRVPGVDQNHPVVWSKCTVPASCPFARLQRNVSVPYTLTGTDTWLRHWAGLRGT